MMVMVMGMVMGMGMKMEMGFSKLPIADGIDYKLITCMAIDYPTSLTGRYGHGPITF